ncbi:MAG: hypothetical protein IIZ47_00215 [Erysipelotrichaceae bacterium]|nr:hypothetical protein [Erysipelotrichaceae bacterium]
MEITGRTRLKEVMKSPSGHDIIARLLYTLGLDEGVVTKTPLGLLTIRSLKRLSMGKLNDRSIEALLRLLNSLDDEEPGERYLAPNENHPDYKRFEADSIVYSLFHNSSNQTSMRQVTYKGKLYDIPNEFFWMSKDTMMNLANENHDDFMFNDARTSKERYVFTQLQNSNIEQHLSETAKQLLSMATDMVINSMKYRILFESDHPDHHIHTWDCGYYQLKNLWKEYLPDDFKKFRDLYKQFGNELRPLVYELGFLRK